MKLFFGINEYENGKMTENIDLCEDQIYASYKEISWGKGNHDLSS